MSIIAPHMTGFTACAMTSNVSLAPLTGLVGNFSPQFAYVTLEGQSARVRFDGLSASAAVGHLVPSGSGFWITGSDMIKGLVMMIPAGSATAMISVGME